VDHSGKDFCRSFLRSSTTHVCANDLLDVFNAYRSGDLWYMKYALPTWYLQITHQFYAFVYHIKVNINFTVISTFPWTFSKMLKYRSSCTNDVYAFPDETIIPCIDTIWPHGHRKGGRGVKRPWILKCDIFLLNLLVENCFSFSFVLVKWNFTAVISYWNTPFGHLLEKSTTGPPWKKSFREPIWPLLI